MMTSRYFNAFILFFLTASLSCQHSYAYYRHLLQVPITCYRFESGGEEMLHLKLEFEDLSQIRDLKVEFDLESWELDDDDDKSNDGKKYHEIKRITDKSNKLQFSMGSEGGEATVCVTSKSFPRYPKLLTMHARLIDHEGNSEEIMKAKRDAEMAQEMADSHLIYLQSHLKHSIGNIKRTLEESKLNDKKRADIIVATKSTYSAVTWLPILKGIVTIVAGFVQSRYMVRSLRKFGILY
mmetsp:Transcript_5662/g.8215  ORF Transcript_5662/g.8215 Transcript_5662/m.8215 type:complete len:238 (+) Transcript_5662:48-761(+)